MAGNTIKLNLINQSNEINHSEVVVFQKNVATTFDELSVAWRVIQNLGQGDHHPFTYSYDMSVSAQDSWGNFTPQLEAYPGQGFAMTNAPSGDVLSSSGPSSSVTEVQVSNQLSRGSINANIYRDGKLLAAKTAIAPAQKAVFEFKPTIWIGVASDVSEGTVMNSAVISSVNTELSLLGIASADIVWTGGGTGPNATPFNFTLQNVRMA